MSDRHAPGGNAPVDFITWSPKTSEPPRKAGTRAYHKKSRTGCQQCRARRVKCDEEHPICRNCQQHNANCAWGRIPDVQSPLSNEASTSRAPKHHDTTRLHSTLPIVLSRPPEFSDSKDRRLLELRLLHHYVTNTAYTFGPEDSRAHDWTTVVPNLAFQHECLLHGIFAITSLHLSHAHPDEPEYFEKYQLYLGHCLRKHRDAVANLNVENADATMLTATLIRICSVASLQMRDVEEHGNYLPPSDWLVMNYGSGHGLAVASWKYLRHDENSIMRRWISNDMPMLDPSSSTLRDDTIFAATNLTPSLDRVLQRTVEEEIVGELWDDDTKKAYEGAAAYIGAVQKGIGLGEEEPTILRRLVLFPAIVERQFISHVEKKKDRALVILAHQFQPWKRFTQLWWVGDVGSREMEAISQAVAPQWKSLLPCSLAHDKH